jgi:hypothetical protein
LKTNKSSSSSSMSDARVRAADLFQKGMSDQ